MTWIAGLKGGTLSALLGSLDCYDFSEYDVIVVFGGAQDRVYGARVEGVAADLIGRIEEAGDGARVVFVDTGKWAERSLKEGYAVDDWGHMRKEGYEVMFAELDL